MKEYDNSKKEFEVTIDTQGNILQTKKVVAQQETIIDLCELDKLQKYIKEHENDKEFIYIRKKEIDFFDKLEIILPRLKEVVLKRKQTKCSPETLEQYRQLENEYKKLRNGYEEVLKKFNII